MLHEAMGTEIGELISFLHKYLHPDSLALALGSALAWRATVLNTKGLSALTDLALYMGTNETDKHTKMFTLHAT